MGLYATPKLNLTVEESRFYHRFDFPELADQPWVWDLRGDEASYLGHYDFKEKRVLEFGAASGFLSFWMERQGAEVVSIDLSPDVASTSWDTLFAADDDPDAIKAVMAETTRSMNNGYWYAHQRLGSKARLVHGTVYSVPEDIGTFDVVTLGAILLHLRDPLGALENALRFTRQTVVITDLVPFKSTPADSKRPIATFVPSPQTKRPHGGWTWWHISPEVYARYLALKGFTIVKRSVAAYRHNTGRSLELFTIVATR